MKLLDPGTNGFSIQIIPLPQFADMALQEAAALGVKYPDRVGSIITGKGDWETVYRLILHSRLAMRVFAPLAEMLVSDRHDLYAASAGIPWNRILTPDLSFAVDVQGKHASFSKLGFAALVVKDAIVDHCREGFGRRPSVDTAAPDLRVHLYLREGMPSTLALDLGGGSLHRRGYRPTDAPAPINEVLAASILEWIGYAPKRPLYDPFCGSGTIVMEAAMRFFGVPAGYFRMNNVLPAKQGPGSRESWKKVRDQALSSMQQRESLITRNPQPRRIFGSDIDPDAVAMTQTVLNQLPFPQELIDSIVQVFQQDARDLVIPPEVQGVPGTVVTNPPYDERMAVQDISQLYHDFSMRAKLRLPEWSLHVITGSTAAAKGFALRTNAKLPLYNGPIRCTLLSAEVLPARSE